MMKDEAAASMLLHGTPRPHRASRFIVEGKQVLRYFLPELRITIRTISIKRLRCRSSLSSAVEPSIAQQISSAVEPSITQQAAATEPAAPAVAAEPANPVPGTVAFH